MLNITPLTPPCQPLNAPLIHHLKVLIPTLLIGCVEIDCVESVLNCTVTETTLRTHICTHMRKPCSGAYIRIAESSVVRSVDTIGYR